MRQKNNSKTIIRLPKDLHEWVRDYAKRNNTFVSEIMRDCLEKIRQEERNASK